MSNPRRTVSWPDKDWISGEYASRSIRSIAAEIGCSPMGLLYQMRRLGIATRTRHKPRKKREGEE